MSSSLRFFLRAIGLCFIISFSLACPGGGASKTDFTGLVLALGGASSSSTDGASSSSTNGAQAQYSLVYDFSSPYITVGTAFNLQVIVYTTGQDVEEDVYLSYDFTISEQDIFLKKIKIDGNTEGVQTFSITIPCGTNIPTGYYSYMYVGLKKMNFSEGRSISPATTASCNYVAFTTALTTTTASVGDSVSFNASVTSGANAVTADVYIQRSTYTFTYTSNYQKAGTITIEPSPTTQTFTVAIPSDSNLVAPQTAKVALYIKQTGVNVLTSNTFSYTTSPPINVSPSGTLSYQSFPVSATYRVDYANGTVLPARGITVQLLDGSNSVVSSTKTNNSGAYSFSSVSVTGNFKIRMVAELKSTSAPIMDITVRNAPQVSSVGSIYAVDSSSVSASSCNPTCTVNVTASHPSSATNASNASGPFAILDTVKRGVDKVLTVNGSTTFPTLSIKSTSSTNGSYFTQSSSTCGTGVPNCIVLLGDEFNDSDHFDKAVLAHEFTHYLEAALSRSDSIGGSHSSNDYLEPRVAYGEGLGNAMGGIINDSKDYLDSTYSGGFGFDLDTGTHTAKGFFSEFSVQSVIWDLYDTGVDTKNSQTDNLSMSFAQIWTAVTSLKTVDSITYFHEFAKSLKSANSGSASAITSIMAMENIATDEASESNVSVAAPSGPAAHTCTGGSNGYAYTPIIQNVTADTGDLTGLNSSQFCGLTSVANNKLFGSRFYKITPASSGTLTVSVTDGQTDQEAFAVYLTRRGVIITGSDTNVPSSSAGLISRNFSVTSGNIYILEVRTYNDCILGRTSTGCYSSAGIGEYSLNINLP